MKTTHGRTGFTLIELLVVISIIALLIGIMLPALQGARANAFQTAAAANARTVGQAALTYETERREFPPSYLYAANPRGVSWRMEDQVQSDGNPNPQNGYLHWSFFLMGGDAAPEGAFSNPAVLNGGAPRTNPGPRPEDWAPGQVNDLGQTSGDLTDRQASRIGLAANGAIIPRNKFAVNTQRKNQLVTLNEIESSSRTILATEYHEEDNWRSIGSSDGDGWKSKSHRPITPFIGLSSGADVYRETNRTGGPPPFRYPPLDAILEARQLRGVRDLIDKGTETTLNAVGRHHPGGRANFLFVDGHVEAMQLRETIEQRLWGEKFYSLTGDNRVFNPRVNGARQGDDD